MPGGARRRSRRGAGAQAAHGHRSVRGRFAQVGLSEREADLRAFATEQRRAQALARRDVAHEDGNLAPGLDLPARPDGPVQLAVDAHVDRDGDVSGLCRARVAPKPQNPLLI